MKKQISLMVCLLFIGSINAFSQAKVRDDAKSNQWRSMVYKQWNFSPDWYYYSWYTKKINLGFTSIKIKVPGMGIHEKGAGGIGIGGDNYVNKYNKNINQITPMVAANKVNELQMEKAKEANQAVYENEVKLFADRTVDYEYLLKKDDLEELKNKILSEVTKFGTNGVSYSNVEVLYGEYDRINGGIDIIRGGHLANAERREAYQEFEQDYKNLLASCKRLNSISKLVKEKSHLFTDK